MDKICKVGTLANGTLVWPFLFVDLALMPAFCELYRWAHYQCIQLSMDVWDGDLSLPAVPFQTGKFLIAAEPFVVEVLCSAVKLLV